MTARLKTFFIRFRRYQKERFPVIVLVISLIPAVLSSAAVVSAESLWPEILVALVASIGYLLHIRIIDEHRDFTHDNEHYRTRPIQAGIIEKADLMRLDIFVVVILLALAVTASTNALIAMLVMLSYSYVAGKEFFLGEKLRKYFFLYNCLNLVQMLLMQIFVYIVLAESVSITHLIVVHFLFTTTGTAIFEWLRKVKLPGQDGTGKDTYTWHLGFPAALWIGFALLTANALFFLWVMTFISTSVLWVWIALLATVAGFLWTLAHHVRRNKQSEQMLQLSILVQYGILNLIIYFVGT